jgi:hypothetical protein
MQPHRRGNQASSHALAWSLWALLSGVAVDAVAQVPPVPPAPTFALVAQSVAQQDYSMVEQRRFRDDLGNVVSVREKLIVDANGSDSPAFELTFLGVCGEPSKSPLNTKWQQTYDRYGRLFVDDGSFHIRDLAQVQQNYTLHSFGTVDRVGRVAFRVVVFPHSLDKSIWLIDFDASTYVPLFAVEFDSQLRLLSEVEAESFTDSLPASLGPVVTMATSSPTVTHADFASAKTHLGDPNGLIELGANVATDYVLDSIRTRDDPLNGQKKLIMTYTDGVDQFMVVQAPNTSDVFAGLASSAKGGGPSSLGHTIGRYRDPALSVLVFWEDGVSFHVAGRGAMQRLDEVAKRVYLQALSTN